MCDGGAACAARGRSQTDDFTGCEGRDQRASTRPSMVWGSASASTVRPGRVRSPRSPARSTPRAAAGRGTAPRDHRSCHRRRRRERDRVDLPFADACQRGGIGLGAHRAVHRQDVDRVSELGQALGEHVARLLGAGRAARAAPAASGFGNAASSASATNRSGTRSAPMPPRAHRALRCPARWPRPARRRAPARRGPPARARARRTRRHRWPT